MASALLGLDGVRVTAVEGDGAGGRRVYAATSAALAACPGCGRPSGAVKEWVSVQPKDVAFGGRPVSLVVVKRRLYCTGSPCRTGSFTEPVAAIAPRCRVTTRLRGQAAVLVAEEGRTVAQAARECGLSWPVVQEAFAARADPLLAQPPSLVAHLGIDEHRRGRPRWHTDPETGEYVLLADRWHTCFADLSSDQGLLGQVEGRTADDAAYWLAQCSPAWRDAVQVVAIDMCSIYASAVRRVLPAAQLVIDLFHVVQLAVKMTGDVRRRAVRERYGRRGRSGDSEYGLKGLLVRNLEHLSPAQFAKIMGTLSGDRAGQEILAAWIGKEKLRDVLNLRARVTGSTPGERDLRGQAGVLLRLVRPERRHSRVAHLGTDDLEMGGRDRRGGAHGSDERQERGPEQARETRSPDGVFLPQSRQPAPPCPDRLHPQRPAIPAIQATSITSGNRADTRAGLTFGEPRRHE